LGQHHGKRHWAALPTGQVVEGHDLLRWRRFRPTALGL
jgi:hypothetical protein